MVKMKRGPEESKKNKRLDAKGEQSSVKGQTWLKSPETKESFKNNVGILGLLQIRLDFIATAFALNMTKSLHKDINACGGLVAK